MPLRPLSRALVLGFGLAVLPAGIRAQDAWPSTGAEREGWSRPTDHIEVLDFLNEIDLASPRAEVRRLALTAEGRLVPVMFLGSPPEDDPALSVASGRATILVLGAIHGDEPSGKEGSLRFIRELALGESAGLLDRVNVIVVPYLNPDGGEAGTRENPDGYDLNRDWIVAETSEVGAVLDRLVNRFRPHVFVDVHNGGAYPYNLTYQATLDPAADAELVAFARGPVYEFVRSELESRGLSLFWYSGPSFDEATGSWSWRTTEPLPRKQHSYGGLRNMVTLLFEVPGRHSLEVGADGALAGLVALTRFVSDNAEAVKGVVTAAARRAVETPADRVFIELVPTAYPGSESFFVPARGPDAAGRPPELVTGENRTLYVASRSRAAPWGYALGPGLGDVVELLRKHGIRVDTSTEAADVDVERFLVSAVEWEEEVYQNHYLADVTVELAPGTVRLPAGSFVIPFAQAEGRLVPQLLEPDAVDSVTRWNFFDAYLEAPLDQVALPVYRLMGPPGFSTTVLP